MATLPGVIGSVVLGLVGPVSVYCDWMRWKVWSATSISVWQRVKLSEQIIPWDTLACYWNGKQPTNNPIFLPWGIFWFKSFTRTHLATLADVWDCRVSAGTKWSSVSILWLIEIASLICNFYDCVAAYVI